MKSNHVKRNHLRTMLWLVLAALLVSGCGTAMRQDTDTAQTQLNRLVSRWGVQPVALRLVGGDHFIDFRYRVIDPEKAVELLSRNHKAYLIDEDTGRVHTVPVTKLGPMRASAVKPKADRNYVVLFGNPDKGIHKGSLVTVVIGDFQAEHMQVM